jgi:endonuclease/exonuclease/phosphatase (EEP) superfamily protein YafD
MNKKTHSFLRLSVRPWGLLTATGAIACSATLFGFLGRFSWFLDLFSHFRAQYLVGLTFLGLLHLLGRHRKTAAVFIAFAGINLGTVLPLYFGGQAAASEGAHILRAMLLNVNTRLGDAERIKQVIQEVEPDILVLEEISSKWVLDLQWLANSYPHSRIQPREDNFGIGLFSKLPLEEGEIVYIGDAEIPSIVATVDTGQRKLGVIATHPLPPAGAAYSQRRNDQLDKLPDYVNSSLPLILLGDLNVTPWNYHFKKLLQRTGLIDSSQGRGIQPTWPNYNSLLLIPIDHCLHSPDVFIVGKRVSVDVGSDHYPVIVDFAIKTEQDKDGPTTASTHTTELAPVRGSS